MQNLKRFLLASRILLVLLLLALFSGCSDDEEGSTGEPGTLERVFSHKVIQGCWTCHDGNQNGPDLTRENFQQSLVGVYGSKLNWDKVSAGGLGGKSVISKNACYREFPMVTKFQPMESSVLFAISKTYDRKIQCESAYQIHTHAALDDEALEDFVQWIENGAPR